MRYCYFAGLLACTLFFSCVKFELPTQKEVKEIFVGEEHHLSLEEPDPNTVPMLDATELGGWRMLCDKCHNGPYYSSNTNLSWTHNDNCESQTTCLNCHGSTLHRLDVKGSKQICIECHIRRDLPVNCSHCHTEGWGEIHTPPGHNLATHFDGAQDEDRRCDSCHGTESWCVDCHGVQMPHPENVLDIHNTLVRGNPDSCELCHGERACEECHLERGVDFH